MSDLFIMEDAPQPLSKEETIELFQKKANGDQDARNKLIEHNIRLVLNTVLKKFNSSYSEMPELVSIGLFGLIQSVDTFDITKGINFSTYAVKCIENEIFCSIRDGNKYKKDYSLDTLISKDGDLTLEKVLHDDNSDFVSDYENKESYMIIRKIISKLPERKRLVVEKYFGFNDNKPQNLRQIAQDLGISRATVSKILITTLQSISYILENQGIINVHMSENQNLKRKK